MAVLEGVPYGSPHSRNSVVDALMWHANGGKSSSPLATGSPQWYQDLIDYYFYRRQRYVDYWDQVEDQYRSDKEMAKRRRIKEERAIRPGRVYAMVHGTESGVLGSPPKFVFEGWTQEANERLAVGFDRAINNEWQEDRALWRSVAMACRDCVKSGWGIALTSYNGAAQDGASDTEARKRRKQKGQSALISAIGDDLETAVAAELAMDAPEHPVEDFENDSRVKIGSISTRRVPYRSFLIDPDCTCLEDAKWVGRRIVARLDSVKRDPLLMNTDSLMPTQVESVADTSNRTDRYKNHGPQRNPYEMVELYEIFERQTDGRWDLKVMARDHPMFLREVKGIYWIGNPYSLLSWNEDGEEIFTMSDVAVVQDEVDAETMLYTKSLDGYSRDQDDTVFIDQEGFNEQNLYAKTKPGQSRYVKVDVGLNQSLRDKILKLPRDSKSAEPLNFLAMIQRAIELGSGKGPNQSLQPLKSGASAQEAAIIQQQFMMQMSHKDRAVEAFVLDIAVKRLGLMAQFYDRERIVRLAGLEAAQAWQGGPSGTWTEADVSMGLQVRIERGSMRPRNDSQLFQDLITTAQVVAQIPIVAANHNWVRWQREVYRALLGVAGESLIISKSEEEINVAQRNLFALQQAGGGGETGGSPPRPAGQSNARAQQ